LRFRPSLIARPRQIYTGERGRDGVPIEKRDARVT
jgi:citrate synthase